MECAKPESVKKSGHTIPSFIMDDLSSRFIINMPEEERTNLVRICFQVEMAHWFYLDFFCTDDSYKLQSCGIRQFALHIFEHVPFLKPHRANLDKVLDSWREYKLSVPTYGAILLDTDLTHVLLVQSYWTKASWGFPKGKVSANEEPWHCASREVLEETGFDISKLINKNDYIESTIHEQLVRLYIIGYIPRDTKFQPRTRNEIKACEWFPLADLPANKKDMTPKLKMGVSANAFFMVLPFVKRMRRWVFEHNPKALQSAKRTRHKSMGELESSSVKSKNNISQGLENEIHEFQNSGKQNTNNQNGSCKTPNTKKEKKHSKRQLFTPQNIRTNNQSPEKESKGSLPSEHSEISSLLNFVAPSWANFKLDRRAILDCLT